MDWTLLIAGYAAVLATIGAAMQLRIWWQDREHVKVEIQFAWQPAPLGDSQLLISVNAINKGKVSVELQSAGFAMKEFFLTRPIAWKFIRLPAIPPKRTAILLVRL